jgi:hypothetical protein
VGRSVLPIALPLLLGLAALALFLEREAVSPPAPGSSPSAPAATTGIAASPPDASAELDPDSADDLSVALEDPSGAAVVEIRTGASAREPDPAGGLRVALAVGDDTPDAASRALEGSGGPGRGRGPLPDLTDPIPVFLLPIGPENGDFERAPADLAPWLAEPMDTERIVVDDGTVDPLPPLGQIAVPFEGRRAALFLPATDALTLLGTVEIDARYDEAKLVWADLLREVGPLLAGQAWRVEIRIAVAPGATPNPTEELFARVAGDAPVGAWTVRVADVSEYIGETVELLFTKEDVLADPSFHARLDAVGVYVGFDVAIALAPEEIDPVANQTLTVTIFGSADFDAEAIDETSLAFGPAGVGPTGTRTSDANGDGFIDFLADFESLSSGLTVADAEACVTGGTLDGEGFEGCGAFAAAVACGLGPELALALPLLLEWRRRRVARA